MLLHFVGSTALFLKHLCAASLHCLRCAYAILKAYRGILQHEYFQINAALFVREKRERQMEKGNDVSIKFKNF